ncbi:MAG: ABC transporter permease subunit [Cyclobacteriaceae bacterium]|nr:ABC transporter permease subunit [Cyclobacteriaceae bacterium]
MRYSLIIAIQLIFCTIANAQIIRVGAKHFNESYILGEVLSQLIEQEGYTVERKFNLGGTAVCYEALRGKAIDLYPEYTGSLAEEILKSDKKLDHQSLNEKLQSDLGLEISSSFGFNNTYALATTPKTAESYGLKKISDLQSADAMTAAMSYEFLKRKDGWENLKRAYQLKLNPAGIEHGLAYQAITNGKIELTDVYSTDGEIEKYNLFLLQDDLEFFPTYYAVAVYNQSLDPKVKRIANTLNGKISEAEMQAMNSEVLFDQKSFSEVAHSFLVRKKLVTANATNSTSGMWTDIADKTWTHLGITAISLGLAIAVAVPLGVLLYIFSGISRPVLYFVGLLQTIPSIALLALMIPLLGIGRVPAITALFLYALLPILRNTTTGLTSVDPILRKVATGMGMTTLQRLRFVELPLAMPSILAGVRTAAVITIGTATLAAFIGAGGLGEFIVTGLALNNTQLILQGAIPAAMLAIVVEFLFELLEKALIPKHLRT